MLLKQFAVVLSLNIAAPAFADSPVNVDLKLDTSIEYKADYTAEPSLALLQDQPFGNPFTKGNWIWSLTGGAALGDENGEVYLATFGIGYHVLDDLSFNLEGLVAYADASGHMNAGAVTEDAFGAGFNVIVRWHAIKFDRCTIFIDGGAGLITFDNEFPAHGTNFNFTPQAGVGFTCGLNDNLMLIAGARWYHISNARSNGKDNNPGFDAGLLYAGVMWPF